jgi:hypothetical protein
MQIRDRVYVGFIMVLGSVVLSQFGAMKSTPPTTTPQFVAAARAQDKKPDPTPAEVKKGIDDLKKDAKAFQRGAVPTPKAKIFAAKRFQPAGIQALPQVAYVPKKLDMWGNNTYGDCVSAEEAFNQAACGTFIESSVVTGWAKVNGYLNGADLLEVMQSMSKSGMVSGGKTYGVGTNPITVDFSNEATLQAALSIAPVKIGIDANALPSGAGNNQGWFTLSTATHKNEDHCVALAGYGTADYLFKQLGVPLPTGLQGTQPGYLLFTWSTIGFVTHGWIMGTVGEAWLRNPSQTINGTPSPNPGPVQTAPAITSALTATATTGALFSYNIVATNAPTSYAAAGLGKGLTCAATTGLITGVPEAAGTFTVTLSATNSSGAGTATLTLTVTGSPTPPTPPTPSNVAINLTSDQILGATRDPAGKVTLNTAQVQAVINASGLVTISNKMSVGEYLRAIDKCKTMEDTQYTPAPVPPSDVDAKINRLEKAFLEFMKRDSAK